MENPKERRVKVDGQEAGYAEVVPPRASGNGGIGGAGAFANDPVIAAVAKLMDTAFRVPGTGIRFGLDPLIGLCPGLGDGAGSLVSVALIGMSARYGIPKIVLVRMALNVILNAVLGLIPGAGDLFSVFFKSNVRNYALFQQHAGARRVSTRGDWLFVGGLLGAVMTVVLMAMMLSFWFISLLFR